MWPFRTRPAGVASDPSLNDQPLSNRLSSDLTIAELFQLLGKKLEALDPRRKGIITNIQEFPSSPPRRLTVRDIHVATRDRRLFLEQERARKQQQSRLQPPSE